MVLILGLGFVLGTILGSLIDCLASRSLTQESFLGRSYCDKCKNTLAWYDLFPILSFIFAKGSCRSCHKKLSFEYLLVEILTGFLVSFTFLQTVPLNFLDLPLVSQIFIGLDTFFKTFVISVLLIVFLTDIKKGLIPDRITYPALLLTFFYLILNVALNTYFLYKSLSLSPLGKYLLPPNSDYFYRHVLLAAAPIGTGLISGLGIGLFFLALILLTRGRGMGGGDLKLGIFIGLSLGFPNSLVALISAFLTGSIVGILLIFIRRKHFGQTIPFGPFLSLGAITALFYGDQILKWYVDSFPSGSIF